VQVYWKFTGSPFELASPLLVLCGGGNKESEMYFNLLWLLKMFFNILETLVIDEQNTPVINK
jgi:hypothetical protein